MSEKDFQAMIIQLAGLLGYTCYHTFDSRRCEPGYPDLSLLRVNPPRFIFAELKTDKGKLTRAQESWIAGLQLAGIEVHVWRPSMWDEIVETLQLG